LTIDPCDHCGAKDWDYSTVLTFSLKNKGQTTFESVASSFGEPLKDYARVTQTPKTSKSSDTFEGLGCLLGLVIVAAIGYGGYYFFFMPDKDYLSSKYNVPVERVSAPPKPHGCDFDDAPLGNKHCHYEKHVYVYDKNDQRIEIDGNPQTCPAGCGPAYSVYQAFVKVED
jgi:hypothetical protein